ncbi:MAG: M48 family metalloprotease [Spirochaetaceae bacterium]|jgi:predicted Zn-dependent protease|nr:M48 family metalloprotease [Spirochaetaceae bacterium]
MADRLFKQRVPSILLHRTAGILFLLLILQIPSAAQGRNTPNPGGAADGKRAENADYTPEDVYYLGRAVAANIVSHYRPYKQNRKLSDYLNNICTSLIINSPIRAPAMYSGYHVLVLDSNAINAFSSPAGHIFITRGLVGCAPSEDALAAVIAHEIAHIQLEHSITLLADKDISLMLELDEVARRSRQRAARLRPVSERISSLRESVQAMTDALFTNGYTQKQEFEADIHALSLLRAAGYQPSALVDLLRVFQQRQERSRSVFYSTHPAPSLRINNIQSRIGQSSANNAAVRKNRFEAAIRPGD